GGSVDGAGAGEQRTVSPPQGTTDAGATSTTDKLVTQAKNAATSASDAAGGVGFSLFHGTTGFIFITSLLGAALLALFWFARQRGPEPREPRSPLALGNRAHHCGTHRLRREARPPQAHLPPPFPRGPACEHGSDDQLPPRARPASR